MKWELCEVVYDTYDDLKRKFEISGFVCELCDYMCYKVFDEHM